MPTLVVGPELLVAGSLLLVGSLVVQLHAQLASSGTPPTQSPQTRSRTKGPKMRPPSARRQPATQNALAGGNAAAKTAKYSLARQRRQPPATSQRLSALHWLTAPPLPQNAIVPLTTVATMPGAQPVGVATASPRDASVRAASRIVRSRTAPSFGRAPSTLGAPPSKPADASACVAPSLTLADGPPQSPRVQPPKSSKAAHNSHGPLRTVPAGPPCG